MRHRHTPEKCNLVLVALGGNVNGQMDSPIAQIDAAIHQIFQAGLGLERVSRMWNTPAFPAGSGPDFVNAALACVTDLAPTRILERLHDIEEQAGRVRGARWAARVIDLDLLAVGDLVLPDIDHYRQWAGLPLAEQMKRTPDELILPHPRMQDRAFVLVPLMDIAPDWRHPVSGRTVTEMHAALCPEDIAQVVPVSHEIHTDIGVHGLSCAPMHSRHGA